jgi:MFS family permease
MTTRTIEPAGVPPEPAGVPPERATQVLPPLRRDPRVLGWAVGHGVSTVGDQILYVALVFTAAQVAPPAVVGLITACAVLPNAVLTLLGGAVVDRTDARRIMIISDLGQLAVLVAALVVLAFHGVSVPLLIALALAFGTATAFYNPASFAFPRQLRPTADLTRVAGVRQLTDRFATIGGPPLGGVLVAGFGLAGALLVDAVTFAVIAIVLLLVRPRWPRERATGATILADVRGGLSYVWSTPRVRHLVIALAGLNVFASPVIAVGLALRTAGEGWGATALGVLMGSIGAAAVLGTLVMLRWRPTHPLVVALSFLLVQAVALMAIGFAPFTGVLAATLTVGLTAGLASPLLAGAFQATVDDAYVARAGSVTTLSDSALIPLSLAGFGLLAGATSVATACAAFGGAFLLQMAFTLSRRQVRHVRADGSVAANHPMDGATHANFQ